MAYIGKTPIVGNFQKCDSLNASATADYTLQVSSTNVVPESVNHMIVSLNGVIQAPTTAYTVSGSTLSFASALTSNDSIDFVILLGNVLDIGTPSDATVTNAKLAQDIISGETELAAIPDTTDEFLISNAGVLNRIDAQFFQNTPAFEAYLATAQSVSEDTVTKLTFTSETFDSDGCFASSTFTPTTAGKYFFYTKVTTNPSAYENERNSNIKIYKNGGDVSQYLTDFMTGGNTNTDGATATTHVTHGIIDMNGSSDYIEVYFSMNTWSDSGSTVQNKVFGAYKIIGA